MSKAQNRNMGRKRSQGTTTPQKANNSIMEILVKSEGNISPVADLRRNLVRNFQKLKQGA
jgi:hypothetical protein